MYILRLATDVEWDSEKECFDTICRETAKFYAVQPTGCDDDDDELEATQCSESEVRFLSISVVLTSYGNLSILM